MHIHVFYQQIVKSSLRHAKNSGTQSPFKTHHKKFKFLDTALDLAQKLILFESYGKATLQGIH